MRCAEKLPGLSAKLGRFDAMKDYLLGDHSSVSYAETASRLGISESAVKSGIHRLRQRYGTLLRQEIFHTVETEEQVEQEIAHLLEILSS